MSELSDTKCDVLIVGAGFAGAAAAVVLAGAGVNVAVVDRRATFQADFRAEQIVGPQLALLQRLGLLESVLDGVQAVSSAVVGRAGHIIGISHALHYGLSYETMVNRIRAQIPSDVPFIIDTVYAAHTGPCRQRVELASGRCIDTRLLVLATGLQRNAPAAAGITRDVVRKAHSLTVGFDITPADPDGFKVPLLCYKPTGIATRIDYLMAFPIDDRMRVNLFTYHRINDVWVQAVRTDPHAALDSALPGLEHVLGRFCPVGPVQVRVNDLNRASGLVRDGVVLIGDAFRTSCPATGGGLSRVLTDTERLCRAYIPQWLASPGMGADKIARFYTDPVKQAVDAECARLAEYQRGVASSTGLLWSMHRAKAAVRRQVGQIVGAASVATAGLIGPTI
ncbi:MAG: FAD-dependent oxidoreductase [Acetobacteraceae bacterium]